MEGLTYTTGLRFCMEILITNLTMEQKERGSVTSSNSTFDIPVISFKNIR